MVPLLIHEATMPTQLQMFEQARKQIAEANEQFMFFVNDGMTREELARNIERRPGLWGRWSHWLDRLPSSASAAEAKSAGVR